MVDISFMLMVDIRIRIFISVAVKQDPNNVSDLSEKQTTD